MRDLAPSTRRRSFELKSATASFTGSMQAAPVMLRNARTTGVHPVGWIEKMTNFLAPRAYSLCNA
jgi:hypothetical protein